MSELIKVRELVFDPRLQCREAMDEDTIARYADAMTAGAEFPAITVIRVNGRSLVADGWHRGKGAQLAGVDQLPAEVRDGTWLDAVEVAAGANETHGLQRSKAAKRRSTLLLLEQPEFCKLSARDLAKKARVSHTYVNKIRKEFGTPRGTLLTAERRAEVEGAPPPDWKALIPTHAYWADDLLKLRFMNVDQLTKQLRGKDHLKRGVELRLKELGCEDWPWPEDSDAKARKERAETVDTVEDIERVILSRDCPLDRFDLLKLMRVAKAPKRVNGYDLAMLCERHKRRPKIVQALTPHLETYRAEKQAQPWQVAREWFEGKDIQLDSTELQAQARRILSRYPERDAAFRALFDDVEDCLIPDCGGWLRPTAEDWDFERCTVCHRQKRHAQRELDQALVWAAMLEAGEVEAGEVEAGEVEAGEVEAGEVEAAEVGNVLSLPGVTADDLAHAFGESFQRSQVLAALLDCSKFGPEFWSWVDSGPPLVGIALDGWLKRSAPPADADELPEPVQAEVAK